jgi:hypothetical protein
MSDGDGSSVEDDELDVEAMIRDQLSERTLKIEWYQNENGDYDGVFANVDSFIELSKGNNIVHVVYLDPNWDHPLIRRSDADWEEKLGRALGNLQSLKELRIENSDYRGDNDEDPPEWLSIAWESAARVLRHVWQKITLRVRLWDRTRGSEEAEAFARAIRGHPSIQRFETDNSFRFDSFGILASALATLPALESLGLHHAELFEELQPEHLEDLPAIVHPERITTLLLSPSLRSVRIPNFYFPNPVCQAVALALRTGSPITFLDLTYGIFPDGDPASIVYALQRNSTLKTLKLVFDTEYDASACGALPSVLLVNTTLTDLTVRVHTMRQLVALMARGCIHFLSY